MTKKAYTEAPAMTVALIEHNALLTGSLKMTVDGEEAFNYNDEPGDAGTGRSRRRRSQWDDDEEEEGF